MGRLTIALALAVAIEAAGVGVSAEALGAPEPSRRGPDHAEASRPGSAQEHDAQAHGPDERPTPRPALGVRRGRRPIEAAATSAPPSSRPLHIPLSDPRGCPLDGYPRLVAALGALENTSDLMSLEVWGDARAYQPLQTVIYHLRVPRPAWVTLFWLGPDGGIYVPFHNVRVPAHRDVTVDAKSIVVPPLGRERWVALATLEPLANPCLVGETSMLEALEALRAAPHGVGRWEVRSQRGPAPAPPR